MQGHTGIPQGLPYLLGLVGEREIEAAALHNRLAAQHVAAADDIETTGSTDRDNK
jgi:hypothetical protein